ncbi:MAG: tetratricopeptide repeat protein, partial [Promethearchaeota archaeon]
YYHENKLENSKKTLEELIEVDSTISQAYNLLGSIYALKKDYKKANNFYFKALELDSTSVGTYYNLGKSFLMMGKRDEAIHYFIESAKLKYNPAIDWLNNNKIAF